MSKLGRFIAGGLDPVKLAAIIGMDCDPWQAEVLRNPHQRELLVVARQGGKSSTASVAAVHAALFDPGALILIAAPSQRQSQELFRTMSTLYSAMGSPVPAETLNTLSITLENRSRIVALPADPVTTRGFSACRLLVVDEAAFVSDEMMASVRPMLSVSHGRMLAMGTPYGRRGWFYEASKSHEWRVTTVTAAENPRIAAGFLAAERVALGEMRYRREYECEFTDLAGRMFSTADIEAIREPAKLGAIQDGPLFLTAPGQPAHLRIVDAVPKPARVRPCNHSPAGDGRHAFRDGMCRWPGCGAVQGDA
jgi:hypothetical protein